MSRNNKTIVFPCVLKTIIAHTHNDDATFSRNDKQIRSTLRAKLNDRHVKNTSWIAMNLRDYDAIRCAYDHAYATRQANTRKRATSSRKRATSSNDVIVNVDA